MLKDSLSTWRTPTAKQYLQERLDAQTNELEQGKTYLVGVAIFRAAPKPASTTEFQLLVVKRVGHEVACPNSWELPGGYVEPGKTVRQCVESGTLEETGLLVNIILREFAELHWYSTSSGKKSVQMNYAVNVKQPMDLR